MLKLSCCSCRVTVAAVGGSCGRASRIDIVVAVVASIVIEIGNIGVVADILGKAALRDL